MSPLLRHILTRLVALIPMLIALSMASFALVHVIPGDPALVMLGGEGTPQQVADLRHGSVAVVGDHIEHQGHTVRAVTFVGDLFKNRCVFILTGASPDGPWRRGVSAW